MTRVATGISQEIVLMLGLGFPELTCWHDLGHDFAGPQPGFVDIGDRVLGNPTMLVGSVEDCRAIAGPDVVPLAVARARIVNLEEELEDLSVADPRRIEDDFDRFGMCSMIAIGCVGRVAACVADARRENAVVTAKEILHAPEATAGEQSAFLGHFLSSTWSK